MAYLPGWGKLRVQTSKLDPAGVWIAVKLEDVSVFALCSALENMYLGLDQDWKLKLN